MERRRGNGEALIAATKGRKSTGFITFFPWQAHARAHAQATAHEHAHAHVARIDLRAGVLTHGVACKAQLAHMEHAACACMHERPQKFTHTFINAGI